MPTRWNRQWQAAAALAIFTLVAAPAAAAVPATSVVAAEPNTGATVVWAIGDLCDDDPQARCEEVGNLISADPEADAVLALGDLQYEAGRLSAFNSYYDPKMGAGKGLKSKTFPVPGNHEYLTSGAAGYFDYWATQAGDRDKGYYATTLGGWRLIATNTSCSRVGGCSPTSAQGQFLTSQLQRPEETCEIVFGHHPAVTDGLTGEHSGAKAMFANTYKNYGDLFLSAHIRSYERFAQLTPNRTVSLSRGVRQLVVGTGGRELNPFKDVPQRSQYRQNTSTGAVRLVLTATGYTAEFRTTDGTTLDTASGTCH